MALKIFKGDVIPLEYTTRFQESKDGSDDLLIIEGVFQRADKKNENNRIYPASLWDKVLSSDTIRNRVASRMMMGELEHPKEGTTDLNRVSHLVTALQQKPDGIVWGAAEVFCTPRGLILRELARRSARFGVSSRGQGTSYMDNGTEMVNDDYILDTFDFVCNPSTIEAYPESRFEADQAQGRTESRDAYVDLEDLLLLASRASHVLTEVSRGVVREDQLLELKNIGQKLKTIRSSDTTLDKICNSIAFTIEEARSIMGKKDEALVPVSTVARLIKDLQESDGGAAGIPGAPANIGGMDIKYTGGSKPKESKRPEDEEPEDGEVMDEMDDEEDEEETPVEEAKRKRKQERKKPKVKGKRRRMKEAAPDEDEMEDEPETEGRKKRKSICDGDDEEEMQGDEGEMEEEDSACDPESRTPGVGAGPQHNFQSMESLMKLTKNQLVERYLSAVRLSESLLDKCKTLQESNQTLSRRYESSVELLGQLVERVEHNKKASLIDEAIRQDPGLAPLRPVLESCTDIDEIRRSLTEARKSKQQQATRTKTKAKQERKKKAETRKDFSEELSGDLLKGETLPFDQITTMSESKDERREDPGLRLLGQMAVSRGWK